MVSELGGERASGEHLGLGGSRSGPAGAEGWPLGAKSWGLAAPKVWAWRTLETGMRSDGRSAYSAHCTLHTAHCTLHTAHSTLHRARTADWDAPQTVCGTLHERAKLHNNNNNNSGQNCYNCA